MSDHDFNSQWQSSYDIYFISVCLSLSLSLALSLSLSLSLSHNGKGFMSIRNSRNASFIATTHFVIIFHGLRNLPVYEQEL